MTVPLPSDVSWEQMPWNDAFCVGHVGIDSDHQRLVSLFNAFAVAVNNGEAEGVTRAVLDDLIDYTHYHFRREESLMAENGYPGFEQHKRMHDIFSKQIEDVNQHLSVGADMSAFLLSFLGKWLGGHILDADRKLGAFLRQCDPIS